jgi:hypothetical protein
LNPRPHQSLPLRFLASGELASLSQRLFQTFGDSNLSNSRIWALSLSSPDRRGVGKGRANMQGKEHEVRDHGKLTMV